MKIKFKKSNSYLWGLFLRVFIPQALVIITIYVLDELNIPTRLGFLRNSSSVLWVELLVITLTTIYASIVGAYVTIHSVKLTILDQEKVRSEDNRMSVLPLLDIEYEGKEYDYRNNYIQFDFEFTEESKTRERKNIANTANITFSIRNVGERELYDLHISNIKSYYFKEQLKNHTHRLNAMIYRNQDFSLNFIFYELGIYDNDKNQEKHDLLISAIEFDCYFKDCYENWYRQSLSISLFHQITKDTPPENRALSISISNAKVISPPMLVTDSELPWNTDTKICYH